VPTPLPPADTDVAEPSTESVEVLVEVTDTVSVPYTTGLQRVTREPRPAGTRSTRVTG
jgi:hypothetical protein